MSALSLLRRRRARRIQQRQQKNAHTAGSLIGFGLVFAALAGFLIIGGAALYASITADLPSIAVIPALIEPPNGALLQPTRIYDRTGTHQLAVLAAQDAPRRYISLDINQPEHLPNSLGIATVTLIDPGFWTHPGYSLGGLTDPNDHPTIAQKLVADLVLWDETPGLRRAIRERLLAAQLTSRYGREKVLEWYLNTAWYGRYAYGIQAAAQLYFGKPAAQLNLAEAALLASVNQSPAINPLDAPQAATQRQRQVLDLIEASGLASREETNLARYSPLAFQPDTTPLSDTPAFTALALAQLETRFDRARVERGGMILITSLDVETQSRASCAVRTQLARLAETDSPPCDGAALLAPLPPGATAPQASASAAVIDPRTGQILALVGDIKNGVETSFLTPHRPGTLLSPFVYLAGFTRGLSPGTLVWDVPRPDSGLANPDGLYHGPLRLRTALANDYPVPAAQIFADMGASLIQKTMRPFGFDLPAASLTDLLDTQNRYTVIDIARAYGIFAAQGTLVGYNTPNGLVETSLLSLRGIDGQVYADWNVPASEQIVSAPLAYLLSDVLSDTAIHGSNSSQYDPGRPAAIKPGASPDGLDTWAAGYTPQRAVVVWMGDAKLPPHPAAGLWSAIMQAASREIPPETWQQPPGILRLTVCDPSGLLPTPTCPNLVTETFIDGYQPVQADTLYRAYAINRETGYLATVYTPPQLIENRIYMQVPPEAASWAAAQGLETPPDTYDTLRAQAPNPALKITYPATFADIQGKITLTGTASGDDFSYYRLQYGQGLNPANWVLITDGQSPVTAGRLAEWDTSTLNGLYALQLLLVHSGGRVETFSTQVSIDNDPPQISLDFPVDGSELSLAENPKITFQPHVTDNLFLKKVDFYIDDKLLQSFSTGPYTVSWSAASGPHSLRIVAQDRIGNQNTLAVKFTLK